MTPENAIRARQKLLDRLPAESEILRGTLVERTVFRHTANCEKCASGQGHPLAVLTVSYPGGRTRQRSLRPEQVPQVRQWLANYQSVRHALEEICEINHHLLRRDDAPATRAGKRS